MNEQSRYLPNPYTRIPSWASLNKLGVPAPGVETSNPSKGSLTSPCHIPSKHLCLPVNLGGSTNNPPGFSQKGMVTGSDGIIFPVKNNAEA